jgi:HSP20 family molecular chaperone IbpA
MKLSDAITLREFERACDELFDEWLGRWRGRAAGGISSAGAVVFDRGEAYEVWIDAAVDDPEVIEIEVGDAGLAVRIPAGTKPSVERRITFSHPVDRERTSARWSEGKLTIVLPKSRGRRIKIQ